MVPAQAEMEMRPGKVMQWACLDSRMISIVELIVANLVDMSGVSDCGEDDEHANGEAGW